MITAFRRLLNLAHALRRTLVVGIHLCLVILANYGAFLLRFDGTIPHPQSPLFGEMLPWLLLVRGTIFIPFRLYEGLWRYTGIWDLRNIVAGVAFSSVAFYLLVHYGFGQTAYSRSIFIIDAVLLVFLMGGVRLGRRVYAEIRRGEARKRALIYGAGDAGEMVVRDMRKHADYGYKPVGFVDDDRTKVGRRIHGIPVLGGRGDLPQIVRRTRPHEIVIAIPTADPVTLRGIVRVLERFKLRITTLPSVREILNGRVSVSQVRNLAPEDLLTRAPIGLDPTPVERLIEGRRVMVTGAGGSIGSELCRQVAALKPASLVMLERCENSLHAIRLELDDKAYGFAVHPVVGDITDAERVDSILDRHRPEILFHAAAHKHVPLMEENPCEAVKNNVRGTRILAEAAERCGVDRFILISTDKAVNPTSVMGASKRLAELVVQAQAVGSGMSYSIVRFGNVLGSNGSVVQRFLEQIRKGGPVTVTHPEMRRFFMLIPEAVHLVLHAAAQAESSATYVLEMGDQVKVADMARDMIRASGFVPEFEIPITFVGLRPGEKLYEELVGRGEEAAPSQIDKVLRVTSRVPPPSKTVSSVAAIETLAAANNASEMLTAMKRLMPEFGEPAAAAQELLPTIPMAAAVPEHSLRAGQSCPQCNAASVHPSRSQTFFERLRRDMRPERLYRCASCGWRGWLLPLEFTAPNKQEVIPAVAPNLKSLDAMMSSFPDAASKRFSPRDLV